MDNNNGKNLTIEEIKGNTNEDINGIIPGVVKKNINDKNKEGLKKLQDILNKNDDKNKNDTL